MYAQDYDERMPNCHSWGLGWTPAVKERYIQQLTAPYVKNEQIWFCPGVGPDRSLAALGSSIKTYRQNGTTYIWNHQTQAVPYGPLKGRPTVTLSGLAVSAIPRPAEAPVLWDMPYWNSLCDKWKFEGLQSPHAKGINATYADGHAKFSRFNNSTTIRDGCGEDWWHDHSWEGYHE
jgi:prepilin-type processing-associated H-X9-DG protein